MPAADLNVVGLLSHRSLRMTGDAVRVGEAVWGGERATKRLMATLALSMLGQGSPRRGVVVGWVGGQWGSGWAWGGVGGLLIAQAGLPLALAAVSFFAVVWVTAIFLLKITGIAPWPWTWGIKYNLFDWTHHVAYVSGTVIGWVLIERVAGGAI